jgi:xylan 1,4-beta-xylosidase
MRRALLLLGITCLPVPLLSSGADADLRRLSVDAATVRGEIRSLQGVNGAPGPGGHKPEYFTFGGWNMRGDVDATAGYRWAHIDLVRTHDAYGPTDLDGRFDTRNLIRAQRGQLTIFPDLHADPDSPASYRFGPSDAILASIRGIGAQVIYRLGRSEGADPTPPFDFDRYAAIARHVVLHFNQGWAGGSHLGIRYWEIWNEPDLGKVFWSGSPAQYYELYARMARAVREADPQAQVGGPAIAAPNDASPYRDGFMDFAARTHVPLDFYSWHWYATDSYDPLDFNRIAIDLRHRLDAHGLTATRSFLTEWNYGLITPPPSPLVRAAFITSAMIYMQDAPIDAAALYRADNVFGADGMTPDSTGQALIALGQMRATPGRLAVEGADQDGLAVLAGRSTDGRLMQVLISNYEIPQDSIGPRKTDDVIHAPPDFDVRLLKRRTVHYQQNRGFDLTIRNLPGRGRYLLERCRITQQERFEAHSEILEVTGQVHIAEPLAPPGIELLRLRALSQDEQAPSGSATWCRANSAPP